MSDGDLVRRAAGNAAVLEKGRQMRWQDWQGPTVYPPIAQGQPPRVDYSTWHCPHAPHCLHYTPCLSLVQRSVA